MSPDGPSGRRRIAGERSRTGAPAPGHARGRPEPKAGSGSKTPTVKTRPAVRAAPTTSSKSSGSKVRRPRRGRGPSGLKPPRHALRWVVPLTALTVAAVVFAAVMAVRGVSDYQETKGVQEARGAAAAKAGEAAETIFSFKYDKLDQHLSKSKKLMTGSFATEFDKIAPALTELAPQRKIDVKATARNAAVEECGDDCSPNRATVLVFFDQSRTMPGSDVPTVFGQRVEITMTKKGGDWLVDDIKAL